MSTPAKHEDFDEILARLSAEFIVDTSERLNDLESSLEAWHDEPSGGNELLALIRREAHSIKGMGGSFGFPTVSNVGHRLEDHLADAEDLTEKLARDIYAYFDVIRKLIEEGDDGSGNLSPELMGMLPLKWEPDPTARPGLVEVFIGIQSTVQRMAVEKELSSLGYRTLSSKSGIELLQMAVTMNPSAVIVSNVMDDLWGEDVARALAAMNATAHIPVGLLTSFDDDRLQNLPTSTVIIHKDAKRLADGLAELAAKIKVRAA